MKCEKHCVRDKPVSNVWSGAEETYQFILLHCWSINIVKLFASVRLSCFCSLLNILIETKLSRYRIEIGMDFFYKHYLNWKEKEWKGNGKCNEKISVGISGLETNLDGKWNRRRIKKFSLGIVGMEKIVKESWIE